MAETWISLAELKMIIGDDAAGTLTLIRGGVSFYLPQQEDITNSLAGLIGLPAMAALCREFGGRYITVPNGKKPEPHKGAVITMLEGGSSHRDIAGKLGVTERYVRIVARYMPRAKQLSLPI